MLFPPPSPSLSRPPSVSLPHTRFSLPLSTTWWALVLCMLLSSSPGQTAKTCSKTSEQMSEMCDIRAECVRAHGEAQQQAVDIRNACGRYHEHRRARPPCQHAVRATVACIQAAVRASSQWLSAARLSAADSSFRVCAAGFSTRLILSTVMRVDSVLRPEDAQASSDITSTSSLIGVTIERSDIVA